MQFRDNDILGTFRATKQIVLCHGCWDMMHLGHIRHLQEAAKMGNYLIVSVTADKHVNKGIGRPYFSAEQRAEALRSLACVDEVVINDDAGAWDLIHAIKPKFFVKGIDYLGKVSEGLEKERAAVKEIGGEMKFTGSQKWSSSNIINTQKFSDEVCQYLETLKKLDARDKILVAFDEADQKVITFVGETIMDEYIYVEGLGRSSKELMLATVRTGDELFIGGVVAASKHGEWKQHRVLSPIDMIQKTRYVDKDFNKKLFDVYSSREIVCEPETREQFRNALQDVVGISDVIVLNDFGHGLMGQIERDIVQHAGFLALNCQTNAGNYGFNLVTKYKNAHYICIDDPEARLAAGTQKCSIEDAIISIAHKIDCGKYLITHGRFGSHWFNLDQFRCGPTGKAQPFAEGGIDTMGAGDAVMAVSAPLIASGLDMQYAAFVGNIVGAIKVSILGHRRHVGRQEIVQTVEALLA